MPCAVNYAESKGAVLTTVIYHVIILYSGIDKITFLGGKYEKLSIILAALLTGLTAVSVFAADPVVDCYVPEKAATVDGIVEDGEWDGATKLTLNISDTSTWTGGGAGIVGSDGYKTYNHTDDDFSTSLSFMCDGTYMYILMTRKDSTMNFATDNFHTPYASDCGLMWFYDTEYGVQYGLQLLASDKKGTPHIGYFFMDADQSTSEDLTEAENAVAVTKVDGDTYVMEAKVLMSSMDDFAEVYNSGSIRVTWCAVNICEDGWDSDDGQHTLWGTNYQAQYVGVNDWEKAPALVLGTDTTAAAETEAPVETEAAPETETAPETEAETVAETEAAPETEPETVAETEAAPETEAETEAPEVVEETVKTEETAPQTFDIGVVAAIAGIVSLAGAAVAKKH